MGRTLVSLALGSAVAAFALPASGGVARPALRLVAASPLKVHGTHFRALERVRVRADTQVRTVRASRMGAFTATFADLNYDRCADAFVVVATGSRGSVARLKLPQLQCAPSLGP